MKNRKYFLALTLSLLSFVLMFSCTKRSDKDEKPQTQEKVNSNTEIANFGKSEFRDSAIRKSCG